MTIADAFRAHVLRAASVTQAMTEWCAGRGIGTLPLRSVIRRRAGLAEVPANFPIDLACDEPVWFRQITLIAGEVPLLDAENWFLPYRLQPAVVSSLLETDIPFGTALLPGVQTRTTSLALVPFGAGDVADGAVEDPDVPLLALRGVVNLDGRPVSFVEERFRLEALG